MTEPTTKPNKDVLNEIRGDLIMYQYPEFLRSEFKDSLDISQVDQKTIKKYTESLSNIWNAYQKVLKYPLYFEQFYPMTEKISQAEALEHHIHAYLQDATILKNKLEVLFGELKNDVGKIAANKKDVIAFFNAGIEKIEEVFQSVSNSRDPHHHRGMRFIDVNVLRAENAKQMLVMLDNPQFSNLLTKEGKERLTDKSKKEIIESLDFAKKKWVDMAIKNNEQISGFVNAIFEAIRPSINQFLKIVPVKEVLKKS